VVATAVVGLKRAACISKLRARCPSLPAPVNARMNVDSLAGPPALGRPRTTRLRANVSA